MSKEVPVAATSPDFNEKLLSGFLRKSLQQVPILFNKQTRGLVSKETVVLRRWGRETQNFGFIN